MCLGVQHVWDSQVNGDRDRESEQFGFGGNVLAAAVGKLHAAAAGGAASLVSANWPLGLWHVLFGAGAAGFCDEAMAMALRVRQQLGKASPMGQDRFDLSGRVGLVSGAASGLGRATAIALAEHGADVLLADLNQAGLRETAVSVEKLGRRAVLAVCNVSEPEPIRAMFAQLDDELGRIDFLGNIAGEGLLGKPEEISLADVEMTWRNLVFGRFAMCQEAGRRMIRQGQGSILNIGSLASITALGRGHVAYSMAMGAVVQMTRELSTEWAAYGVRVNAILPAQVINPSLEKRMAADPGLEDQWLRGIPRGRLGRPEDIQGLAVLLASDASSWITGALIPMDGGNLAMNAGGTRRYES
jgi:NAD(P)-dependent dehydrogenase (short-subunit alcohol dehydrogenase family)